MEIIKTTILILLFTSVLCTAQVPPFTKCYNLDPEWVGNYFEQIIHTHDGGYAAAFNQNHGFTMRTSLLKLDQYGEVEWQTIVADTSYLNVRGFSLCIDNNDKYVQFTEIEIYKVQVWG